jgi:hypothetical protein
MRTHVLERAYRMREEHLTNGQGLFLVSERDTRKSPGSRGKSSPDSEEDPKVGTSPENVNVQVSALRRNAPDGPVTGRR